MGEPELKAASLGAVILAAGAGRRYGGPKIVAEQGEWLDRALAAVAGCKRVAVTVGASSPLRAVDAELIEVPDYAEGLSRSVLAALEWATEAGVSALVLQPVDTPGVTAAVLDRLRPLALPGVLARAVYDGVPGHPVLIGREHFPGIVRLLLKAPGNADRGAGPYLAAHPDTVLVECGDLADGSDRDTRS